MSQIREKFIASLREVEDQIDEEVDILTHIINSLKTKIRHLQRENYILSTKKELTEEKKKDFTSREENDLLITDEMMKNMTVKFIHSLRNKEEEMDEEVLLLGSRIRRKIDRLGEKEKKLVTELTEKNERLLQHL